MTPAPVRWKLVLELDSPPACPSPWLHNVDLHSPIRAATLGRQPLLHGRGAHLLPNVTS